MTDSVLEEMLFPKDNKTSKQKRLPDFDYIRKELLRNGVNKKLLWTEYCEECRLNNDEPLMYSQFCYHIQKDEEKRRATMHIPRKPGEQIGPSTAIVIDAILTSGRIEQQSYRSCMGLLKLADRHTSVKLEAACKKALEYTSKPSYKSIKDLLTNLRDKLPDSPATEVEETPKSHGITRGARYYGGKKS